MSLVVLQSVYFTGPSRRNSLLQNPHLDKSYLHDAAPPPTKGVSTIKIGIKIGPSLKKCWVLFFGTPSSQILTGPPEAKGWFQTHRGRSQPLGAFDISCCMFWFKLPPGELDSLDPQINSKTSVVHFKILGVPVVQAGSGQINFSEDSGAHVPFNIIQYSTYDAAKIIVK